MQTIAALGLLIFALGLTPAIAGQSGNGGNGCNIRSSWLTFEELNEDGYDIRQNFSFFNPSQDKQDSLSLKKNQLYRIADLSKFHSVSNAKSKFRVLKKKAPLFYQAVSNYMALFSKVFILKESPEGIFEGEIGVSRRGCSSFHPAILSHKNGAVVFYIDVWNSIANVETLQILIIHETLRFLQLHHPSFASLSNEQLQRLTNLINQGEKKRASALIAPFEKLLEENTTFTPRINVPTRKQENFFQEELDRCNQANIDLKSCLFQIYSEPGFIQYLSSELLASKDLIHPAN